MHGAGAGADAGVIAVDALSLEREFLKLLHPVVGAVARDALRVLVLA